MTRATKTNEPVAILDLSGASERHCEILYAMLVNYCTDQALTIVLNSGTNEGLLAWRNLARDADPTTTTTSAKRLSKILDWSFSGDAKTS